MGMCIGRATRTEKHLVHLVKDTKLGVPVELNRVHENQRACHQGRLSDFFDDRARIKPERGRLGVFLSTKFVFEQRRGGTCTPGRAH